MKERLGKLALCTSIIASCFAITSVHAEELNKPQYSPEDNFTDNWTREEALRIQLDPSNTIPLIPPNGEPVTNEKAKIGDAWPLTNLNGEVVKYKGWNILFSLTNAKEGPNWAKIGYYYSRDGKSWKYGGNVFPEGASLSVQEWSGSTLIEGNNEISVFYTTTGETDKEPQGYEWNQRIASAKGRIQADENGVRFTGFERKDHKILLEPDGKMYQTWEQYKSAQPKSQFPGFRDPWVFKDPKDGKTYMLFHGSKGGNPHENNLTQENIGNVPEGHEVPEDSKYFVGNIGLAVATDKDLKNWKLLPPLLSAHGVSQELERPHLVFKDNKYYLFIDEHKHKFAPGLKGPDGLYGFVGSSLRGDYQPLNGSSLVLGNPEEANYQSFAWNITPNNLVQSFIMDRQGDAPGGNLAPTLKTEINGTQTRFVEQLDYGYVPETTDQKIHPKASNPK
ncbi:glycoside hydrolase family 68 protein [Bacillus gobiensis]|uniref:glycoside hydrolase family 68 protein n=1 Tax=Bacillus gobiensis TaxID=1441095 RepID=UPI003D2473C7